MKINAAVMRIARMCRTIYRYHLSLTARERLRKPV